MKRFMALLLAALLLFTGMAAAEDKMDAITKKLEGYLSELSASEGKSVNTTALEECLSQLEAVKTRQKKPLELYCRVLLLIEQDRYDEANQYMYVLQAPSMASMLDEYFENQENASIYSVQELADYLQGRECEYQEKYEEAIDAYMKCMNSFDVYDRLENAQLMLYFSAVDRMTEGDYEGARTILEKLEQMHYSGAASLLNSLPTPMPRVTEMPTSQSSSFLVGSYVEFGSYPQNSSGTDDTTIEWKVLARDGQDALLISRYALDCMPYNDEAAGIIWKTCSLRNWLNEDFYNRAFDENEKKRIIPMTILADNNLMNSSYQDTKTEDHVFILSISDVERYLRSDVDRICAPTDYAMARGAKTSDAFYADGRNACWWWLRSPGMSTTYAAYVSTNGSLYKDGSVVNYATRGVRPCIWVTLVPSIETVASNETDETTEETDSLTPTSLPRSTRPEDYLSENWKDNRYAVCMAWKDWKVGRDYVERIQLVLNTAGYRTGNVNGIFGKGTADSLARWQKDHMIRGSAGVCTPLTAIRLLSGDSERYSGTAAADRMSVLTLNKDAVTCRWNEDGYVDVNVQFMNPFHEPVVAVGVQYTSANAEGKNVSKRYLYTYSTRTTWCEENETVSLKYEAETHRETTNMLVRISEVQFADGTIVSDFPTDSIVGKKDTIKVRIEPK